MTGTFDIAVIGLGAMGSATLHQLAKRGLKVVGIDRFHPPHDQGSTHGETRITRQGIGEGEAYVPLALRAHEIWREMEAETGKSLLHAVGALIVSRPEDMVERPGRTGFLQRSIQAAKRFGIAHEVIGADEVRRRYPNILPSGDEVAYFEPGGGYLDPEACVAANLDLAARYGASLLPGTRVTGIESRTGGIEITIADGRISAGQAIVSAGAWAGPLLGAPFASRLKPTRQVMHWFSIAPDMAQAWRRSPVFMWPHGDGGDDFFYGFPSRDGVSFKTADEYYGPASDPDRIERLVEQADSQRMFEAHLKGRLAGVDGTCLKAVTCLYTATEDSRFLIDRHPDMPGVIAVSPCSGHGFKHSAAIGEAVAQLAVDGTSRIALDAFGLEGSSFA